jgi:hypothetical protein
MHERTNYKSIVVNGLSIFYREVGSPNAPLRGSEIERANRTRTSAELVSHDRPVARNRDSGPLVSVGLPSIRKGHGVSQ